MSARDDRQQRLVFTAPETSEAGESAPVVPDREPKRFVGAGRPRARLTLAVVALGFWSAVICGRLIYLQVYQGDYYRERAAAQQRQWVKLESPRGTIFDRSGRELAVSADADSLSLHPFVVEDVAKTAAALAPHVGRSKKELEKLILESRAAKRRFVWLDRKASREVVETLRELDIPGVGFIRESRRFYPHGRLAAATLGFVGTDPRGLSGVEALYDSTVRGRAVERQVVRDAGKDLVVVPAALDQTPQPGADLYLTIDATLQHIVESELEERVKWAGAKGGSAILLDPEDSAILAIASYPGFDPANFGAVPKGQWRNRVVSDSFEPGSTFKMVTAAAAIEAGIVHPDDRFDCGNGGIRLGRTYIRDHKPFDVLSFREIIAKSSNVGVIRVALETGSERLHEMTLRFGFGQTTGVDLPGEHSGLVHPLERWERGNGTAYISFGHFLTVTPIQVANAYAALANGGVLHQPYLVRAIGREGEIEEHARPEGKRILSRATTLELIRLLEGVVAEGGSATRAAIDGYQIAGKTGTAEKSTSEGYDEEGRIASFVGIAPSRSPRLVGMVVLHEPDVDLPYGGVVAAPTYQAIVSKALLHLGVPPEPLDARGTRVRAASEDGPRPLPSIRLSSEQDPVVAAMGGLD
ncbi:MAG: penicillin-binding protein 2 [Acidobacteriota bacterium]